MKSRSKSKKKQEDGEKGVCACVKIWNAAVSDAFVLTRAPPRAFAGRPALLYNGGAGPRRGFRGRFNWKEAGHGRG